MTHDMTVRFELFAHEPRTTAAFYRDALGFTVVGQTPGDDGTVYIELRNGDAVIGVQSADTVTRAAAARARFELRAPPTGVELVLEVADVAAYHERMRQYGHPLDAPLQERPWGETDFRVLDPDGYYLRITSRHTARYARRPDHGSTAPPPGA